MTDSRMNFHDAAAPKIAPRILCIGMPVRDLTFRVPGLPARGSKEHASHFDEICGGNALNGAIGIVRLGGRASICGPMGDARETTSRYIFEKLAHEGIDTQHIVHMPGLVTPISNIMIDPSGERTIVTFRDPELWKVHLPDTDSLLEDCGAILTESRCAAFCTDLCVEARRRGPIETTGELRAIVERALGARRRGGAHPATRTFQALRIAVNREMESLAALLRDGPAMLNPGGRMLIISYHSLEDRPVKERFRELVQAGGYAAISRKVIKPSSAETSRNSRARSAKVRCIERSAR